MYEQVSHSLLNRILDQLDPEFLKHDLRHFHTRLGANFYAIHCLFQSLYGKRDDFESRLVHLVHIMAKHYLQRDMPSKLLDAEREQKHTWFLSQEWVGMALYANSFASDLNGLQKRLPYLQELGINLVHVMPVLKCPPGASDGGYAVSDFRDVDDRVGSLYDLQALVQKMRSREMLLVLDVVVNHTSDQHEWARRARAGEQKYQDYYHVFDTREIPDAFEESMPEIFPETAPGNFTWDEDMGKWVMTVFNNYQWDLNYRNPAVLIEMLDIILFWANQGADILRLDAVAFLWKKMGTPCQNEHEAHLILQLLKDCCQVSAPGVLFIAEAIVAPVEIIKYFGEDAVNAKECEIAYNATLMALLWDAVATSNAKLLNQGIRHLPNKLDQATWLNYVRCHDDIGLGFDDADIHRAGYDPRAHRKFLINYFTGAFPDSQARGQVFGRNDKSDDARIAGSLASLVGLESALERHDDEAVDRCIDLILLLHSIILSFGGIPLLYYGDEIGTLNDFSYLDDQNKVGDSRWMHRPQMDWSKAERRGKKGTIEQRLFDGLRHLIAVRKRTSVFADFNNRELVDLDDPHLFAYIRTNPLELKDQVLVVANFDGRPHEFDLQILAKGDRFEFASLLDLCSGQSVDVHEGKFTVPAYQAFWLSGRGQGKALTLTPTPKL